MKKSRKKKIIEENKETLVGTFKRSQNFGFVIPDDKNVEGDIYIPKRKMAKARNNQKVVVQIDKKADRKNKAEGAIIEVIGYSRHTDQHDQINQTSIRISGLIETADHLRAYLAPIRNQLTSKIH